MTLWLALPPFLLMYKKKMSSMTIKVNGKTMETGAKTLAKLAAELQLPDKGVAMALDMQMVQRQQWEQTFLTEGCSVLIIKAACGG